MFNYSNKPSYIRAFLTVLVFYGMALVINFLESDTIFRVSLREHDATMVTWPMLLALWWMVILHLPLPAYFWFNGVRLNPYFSNELVFRVLFATWYGCISGMAFLVVIVSAKYGWITGACLVFVIMAQRGERLRRLVEYGSTCASFFVFYRASGDVPSQFWPACYIGIGIVQCAFLALLEMALTELFTPAPESVNVVLSEAGCASGPAEPESTDRREEV